MYSFANGRGQKGALSPGSRAAKGENLVQRPCLAFALSVWDSSLSLFTDTKVKIEQKAVFIEATLNPFSK